MARETWHRQRARDLVWTFFGYSNLQESYIDALEATCEALVAALERRDFDEAAEVAAMHGSCTRPTRPADVEEFIESLS